MLDNIYLNALSVCIVSECYFLIHSLKKVPVSHGEDDNCSPLSTPLFHNLISQDKLGQCNEWLVSVGPAGSGLKECSHTEPALSLGSLHHWEARLCWGPLQDMALNPILFLWRGHVPVGVTMSCPPKVCLIMNSSVFPSYRTDQSCSFTCLVELHDATIRACSRSTKSFTSHPLHYYYFPACTALSGSRGGRDAVPSWRRAGWTLTSSRGWGSGAKQILQEEEGAWDEEETEPLRKRAKQSDSREKDTEKKKKKEVKLWKKRRETAS